MIFQLIIYGAIVAVRGPPATHGPGGLINGEGPGVMAMISCARARARRVTFGHMHASARAISGRIPERTCEKYVFFFFFLFVYVVRVDAARARSDFGWGV